MTTPAQEAAAELTADAGRVARDSRPLSEDPFAVHPAPEPDPVEDVDPVLDLKLVRKYRELREAQAISEAEGEALKAEADKIEQQLVEMFADAGVPSLQLDGKTIYLHTQTFAQWEAGMSMDEKKALLREAGAGELVSETVNAQTLSAWVRELVGDDDNPGPGLPEELTDVLQLGERYSIRINAAGQRRKSRTRSK